MRWHSHPVEIPASESATQSQVAESITREEQMCVGNITAFSSPHNDEADEGKVENVGCASTSRDLINYETNYVFRR